MSKKAAALLFLLILSPIVIYLLWPSDEGRIKRLVKEGADAVEREDIEGVMSKVSFSYHNEYGLNYMMLKRILAEQFELMSEIDVEYENLRVEVKDREAAALMDIRMIAAIGQDTGYYIGDIKEPLHIKLHLNKERAKWLVVGAEGLEVKGLRM